MLEKKGWAAGTLKNQILVKHPYAPSFDTRSLSNIPTYSGSVEYDAVLNAVVGLLFHQAIDTIVITLS